MNDSYLEPLANHPRRTFVDPDDDPCPVGLLCIQHLPPDRRKQWLADHNPRKENTNEHTEI